MNEGKELSARDKRLLVVITHYMESYGMPEFTDKYPAMDILQIVKDAGYGRVDRLDKEIAELVKVNEESAKRTYDTMMSEEEMLLLMKQIVYPFYDRDFHTDDFRFTEKVANEFINMIVRGFIGKIYKKETCTWSVEECSEYNCWETGCGHRFIEDTPEENDMVYCCYCGRKIMPKINKGEDDE